MSFYIDGLIPTNIVKSNKPISLIKKSGNILWSNLFEGRYRCVSYIQALDDGSTNPYIDLGINGTTITRFIVKGTCAPNGGSNTQLLGGNNPSATTFFGCRSLSSSYYWYCSVGSSSLGVSTNLSTTDCIINSSTSQTGTLTDHVTGRVYNFERLTTSATAWGFPDENLRLFSGNTNRLSPDATCHGLQLYTSQGLAKQLVPVYDMVDEVYGMYDIINNQFLGNAGTGEFTGPSVDSNYTGICCNPIGDYISVIKNNTNAQGYLNKTTGTFVSFGSQYKCVPYIESTGDEYINTGLTLTNQHTIKLRIKTKTYSSAYSIFGSRQSATANNIAVLVGGSSNLLIDFNNSDYAPYRLSTSFVADTIYDLTLSANLRKINTLESTTLCEDTISTATAAYLFSISGAPASSNKFNGICYGLQVDNGNTPVAYMIPVYDTVNDEYGMYDIVRETYYGNASGSGAFTGPSV